MLPPLRDFLKLFISFQPEGSQMDSLGCGGQKVVLSLPQGSGMIEGVHGCTVLCGSFIFLSLFLTFINCLLHISFQSLVDLTLTCFTLFASDFVLSHVSNPSLGLKAPRLCPICSVPGSLYPTIVFIPSVNGKGWFCSVMCL